MIELLNSLFVLTQGSYLRLEHDTVRVEVDGVTRLRAPLIRLGSIVMYGNVSVSPFLIHRCAEDGRSLVWMTQHGRFRARVEGPVHGNVLLRNAQHDALRTTEWRDRIARQFVAAKIQNSRILLLRVARDTNLDHLESHLSTAAERLAASLCELSSISSLDPIRGIEGDAARTYFGVFGFMVRDGSGAFSPDGRSRRPPRDRVNALLSFLYALLRGECAAALDGVGLDPQVGFLHALRPGRPALALDLMEEFRPLIADRLALTLINRRQLNPAHFESTPGGAMLLTEDGRRTVLAAYQGLKERPTQHRLLQEKIPLGLIPHIQARLLARHLRGDLPHYPAFLGR